MDPRLSVAFAIYGAVLSSVVFLWQIYQWRRSHPRIVVKAMVRNMDLPNEERWISFEIRNRGGKATTIEEIMFVDYANWFMQLVKVPNKVEYLSRYHKDSIKLPAVLQPNDLWTGRCPLLPEPERARSGRAGTRRMRFECGRLFYRIQCSHLDRPLAGVVEREPVFDQL